MEIQIDHTSNRKFSMLPFTSPFAVDIHQSVKSKLTQGELLTSDKALKIFKDIKWESDIKSFFTKPVVLISFSLGLFIAGLSIPVIGPALLVARVVICALAGGLLGYSLQNSCNSFLPQLNQAYSDQSQKAAEYINTIETAKEEITFKLAPNNKTVITDCFKVNSIDQVFLT